MLICIDVGNTHIVIGIYKDVNLLSSFRFKTDANITEDEYGIKLKNILNICNITTEEIEGAIISSVVPTMDSILEKMIIKYLDITPIFVGPGIKSGINIKIDDPRQLGSDLLVGAVAAVSKYGYPVIIIDMGTATTLSVVNSNQDFIGGIIIPGVISSTSSLIKATSRLEEAKFDKPKYLVGRNTVNSIQSGMIYGTSSMLDGLIRKVKKENGESPVILTGGIANRIAPFLEEEVILDNNLILDGLRILYEKNK